MSRYVVTGGSGRLGRSVVEQLATDGHEVISIDLRTSCDLPAEQLTVDLMDAVATNDAFASLRPDGVVHLAGIAIPFIRPEPEIYSINTTLAHNVFDAVISCGASSVLVSSSPTVIGYGNPSGWSPRYLPIDEHHPVAPWHAYAASKQAIEQLVAVTTRRHRNAVHCGIFRPCYVITPEDWLGGVTQQGHTVSQRLNDPSLSATALFNYVDARDAADFVAAWFRGATRLPNGTCFFVGATDALANQPLSDLLPRHVAGVGDRAAKLCGQQSAFDCSRAHRLLGWRARRSWRTELAAGEDLDSVAST